MSVASLISRPEMMANVISSKWPANMLAKSRTHSDSGRVMRIVISSMNINSGRIGFGTPGGMSEAWP